MLGHGHRGPGMGGSAILTTWLAPREAAGAAVPHHFIAAARTTGMTLRSCAAREALSLDERFELREPEADERLHPAARLHRCCRASRRTTSRRYALRHALIHRAVAGDWTDAWRVVGDLCFLEAKCRELGVHETEADVTRLAECCRASGVDVKNLNGDFGDI